MTELVDRIAAIIKWHTDHMGEADDHDCRAAAEDIVKLLADPSVPTQPEEWAVKEAKREAEDAALGTREERLARYANP